MQIKSAVRLTRACWLTVVAATGKLLCMLLSRVIAMVCLHGKVQELATHLVLSIVHFAAAPKHVVVVLDIDLVAC